jgi:hypothetical protein
MDSTQNRLSDHSQAHDPHPLAPFEDALRSLVDAAVRVVTLLPRNSELNFGAIMNDPPAGTGHAEDRLSDVHKLLPSSQSR